MNIALWILQGLVAAANLAFGILFLVRPPSALISGGLKWAEDFAGGQIKLIGLAKVAGAIGLVVPWATGILPILTPLAAVGTALLMGGAVMVHRRRREPIAPPLVVALLAVCIAIGRTVLS